MPEWNRKKTLKNLIGLVLLPPFLFLFLRWFEHRQVYIPYRGFPASGDQLNRKWEDVYFEASDGTRLNGWYFEAKPDSPRAPWVVLFCHGNAGNISTRLQYYQLILDLGASLFAFDYRGYGRSGGSPSEEGTYLDAMAAHDWLTAKGFDANRIVVLGESLGGGIAAELATRRATGGLILQSSFTSIPALGSELFPFLPVRLIGKIQYDTLSKLPQIRVPVLVMHSRIDTIVGYHHGEQNYQAASEPKMFRELHGDHNDTLITDAQRFQEGLDEFFRMIESPRPSPPAL